MGKGKGKGDTNLFKKYWPHICQFFNTSFENMFNANEEFHKKTTLRFLQKRELTQNDKNNTIDECFIVRPNNIRSDECPFLLLNAHLSQLFQIIDNEYLTARKFLTGSIFKVI
ncbi:unnamed protein product [Rhizophagus irregularis]|nr:unnamed protein product [Rhizophagus irregularis]